MFRGVSSNHVQHASGEIPRLSVLPRYRLSGSHSGQSVAQTECSIDRAAVCHAVEFAFRLAISSSLVDIAFALLCLLFCLSFYTFINTLLSSS